MRDQPQVHEPAFFCASVSDDNGNVRRSLGATLKRGVYGLYDSKLKLDDFSRLLKRDFDFISSVGWPVDADHANETTSRRG